MNETVYDVMQAKESPLRWEQSRSPRVSMGAWEPEA